MILKLGLKINLWFDPLFVICIFPSFHIAHKDVKENYCLNQS